MRRSFCAALLCLASLVQAQTASEIRYVWASKLILRTEPDARSAEIARLAYGAKVALLAPPAQMVAHKENVGKLRSGQDHPAADITLDGYWRQIDAAGKQGWVFDGYLSRYPVPGPDKSASYFDDEEMLYAARIFGVARSWRWQKSDGKKSPSYQVMRQHWKLDDDFNPAEIYWVRAEYKLGGSAEYGLIMGEMTSSTLTFKGLPLTFNEALLWQLHFHPLQGTGTFAPQRSLQIGPADDDSGVAFGRTIECNNQTCNISRDMAD